MSSRLSAVAAEQLRAAIKEAGGIEIFAVGDVVRREVVQVEVHARGTEGAVVALRSRARAGQVVIHNHPSGILQPSEPDMALASAFGEEGVGFVIVNNTATQAQWVVEPLQKKRVFVDEGQLEELLVRRLPTLVPGWEARPGQLQMAMKVLASFNDGGTVLLEAGTGTGKSLAYLLPAALWALANDAKVVVSTYTRTLQGQLLGEDLPLVTRLLPARVAVLKGRNNYICRRKLGQLESDPLVEDIRAWAQTSPYGDRDDLPWAVEEELWDRMESDTDQTLRAACPHYNTCFYYNARRRAAAAHLIVVNHALLLMDLSIKQDNVPGILPAYDRVVLDEAHHLEGAATSASEQRLSGRGVSRTLGPLMTNRKRPGAIERLMQRWPVQITNKASEAAFAITELKDHAQIGFELMQQDYQVPLRVRGEETPHAAFFEALAMKAQAAAGRLGAMQALIEDLPVQVDEMQPVLDVGRGRRRLEDVVSLSRGFLVEDQNICRYFDPGVSGVGAVRAPVDVAPTLQKLLGPLESVVLTSATLAVNGKIDHYANRLGFVNVDFHLFPSPFNYQEQSILALPKDIPHPDDPSFVDVAAGVIIEAIEASGGGAFVLCTSYKMVQALAMRVEAVLGNKHAILKQGKGQKGKILEHFRRDKAAVLFGTDSFWEGVSVKGEGLRLVIIPRLPFRVPTEPVSEARYELLQTQGLDPFRAWSLPEAVIKLRQGFGRLIRAQSDRGVVLMLDRRLHEMWYGRLFLSALPSARRVVGPARVVMAQVQRFYRDGVLK